MFHSLENLPFSKTEFMHNNPELSGLAASALYLFMNELVPSVLTAGSDASADDYDGTKLIELVEVWSGSDGECETYGMDISTKLGDYYQVRANSRGEVTSSVLDPGSNTPEDLNIQRIEQILTEATEFIPDLKVDRLKDDIRKGVHSFEKAKEKRLADIQTDLYTFSEVIGVNNEDAEFLEGDQSGGPIAALVDTGFRPFLKQYIGEKTKVVYSSVLVEDADTANERMYCVAYTLIDSQQWMPQIFYKSNSQAYWRWLPGYDKKARHFSKGQDEIFMNPPMQVQLAFEEALKMQPVHVADNVISKLLEDATIVPQTGIIEGIDSSNKYAQYFEAESLLDTAEVQPDFSQIIQSIGPVDSLLYGRLYTDVFNSKNGEYEYVFTHASNGMAWLQTVTPRDNTIRQHGLVPDRVVDMGLLLQQPGFEYKTSITDNPGPMSETMESYSNNFGNLAESGLLWEYYQTIPKDHLDFMSSIPEGIPPSIGLYLLRKPTKGYRFYDDEYTVDEDAKVYEAIDSLKGSVSSVKASMRIKDILNTLSHPFDAEDMQITGELRLPQSEPEGANMQRIPWKESEYGSYYEYIEEALTALGACITNTIIETRDPSIQYEYYDVSAISENVLILVRKNGIVIEIQSRNK
jgi:hypothetical protein